MIPSTQILGVRVDIVDWGNIRKICRQFLVQDQPRQIVTVNGEFILAAQKNPTFRDIINSADLVIADSTNVVWAARIFAHPGLKITPGSELVEHLAKLAISQGHGLFLLGGQEGIAKRAAIKLVEKHPGLRIDGTSAANPDDQTTVRIIKRSGAKIVLVAYGQPHQESWIAKHKNGTGARILVGVGGTFDMLAGRFPRAPQPLRLLHLEWLWRLLLQPSRWRRVWRAVIVFPWRIFWGRVTSSV